MKKMTPEKIEKLLKMGVINEEITQNGEAQ